MDEELDARWQQYHEAGEAALRERKYPEAEEHYVTALRIAEQFSPSDSRLFASLHGLIKIYDRERRYRPWEETSRRLLALQEQAHGADDPDPVPALHSLAHVLDFTERPAKAQAQLNRALQIQEHAWGT